MKILTWNTNFWQSYGKKGWKNNITQYILSLFEEYDFILLQESNPSIIFDKDENQFEINDKIIFFNKLLDKEIGADSRKKIIPWGNSIIADKRYRFIRNNFINKNGEIENYYFGKSAFMCFDFHFIDTLNITLLNFYNKNMNGDYPMLKNVLADIENILKIKDGIIILSGDFNSDIERDPNNREFFNQLKKLGLVNCTEGKEFKTTMVPEIGNKRQYPNDKIFVNKPWKEIVECKLIKNTTIELSDHRPIECIVKIFDLASDKDRIGFSEETKKWV